jgi:hypothetical protein
MIPRIASKFGKQCPWKLLRNQEQPDRPTSIRNVIKFGIGTTILGYFGIKLFFGVKQN